MEIDASADAVEHPSEPREVPQERTFHFVRETLQNYILFRATSNELSWWMAEVEIENIVTEETREFWVVLLHCTGT